LVLGRIEEALRQLRAAEKTDPLSPAIHFALAYALLLAGRYDEAANYCQRPPADSPAKSECLGRVRLSQGRIEEAIRLLVTALSQGVSAGSGVRGYLGFAYARAGHREDAEELAAGDSLNPLNQALIFAGLGDKDRTFGALDRSAAAGPFRIGRALTFPEFALLRGDPRLKALRKKLGLPE
jgi:tetratricopeptide (TPR) repeat protein